MRGNNDYPSQLSDVSDSGWMFALSQHQRSRAAELALITFCSKEILIGMEEGFEMFSKKDVEHADTGDLLITAGRLCPCTKASFFLICRLLFIVMGFDVLLLPFRSA